MTNLDLLVAEMELDPATRARLAAEIIETRYIVALCRRFKRRLPHQVANALKSPARITELDPPPDPSLAPGLFSTTHTD